jgi:hypothetical protein
MNVLNDDQIRELTKHRSPLSVSLFIPTHRTGRERRQDSIRLKNVVNEAREKMRGGGGSAATIDEVLQPAVDLRSDDEYWRHRSDGLACFCAPGVFRSYRVPIKLAEYISINERFYIRPLLPLLRSDARLYILTLTQETAGLFEATKYSIREIQLLRLQRPDVNTTERPLQFHSHKDPSHGKGNADTAIYHGHGGPADRAKVDAMKFFQSVDRAVASVLQGQRSPLVLACVGYLASLYQSVNSYGHLLNGKVPGSPDRWSEDELRDHAWKMVEPHFRENQEKAWQQFRTASSQGRAAEQLHEVVLAADEGRIETLFLTRGERRWGHVDSKHQAVHTVSDAEDGEELLDYAATRTLSNRGDVYLLDSLPDTESPVAATLRY